MDVTTKPDIIILISSDGEVLIDSMPQGTSILINDQRQITSEARTDLRHWSDSLDGKEAELESEAKTAGEAAAVDYWNWKGNSPELEDYVITLRGLFFAEDEIQDQLPFLDLSGQFAGGLTTDDILMRVNLSQSKLHDFPEAVDELLRKYQEAYDEAVIAEIERFCAERVDDFINETITEIEDTAKSALDTLDPLLSNMFKKPDVDAMLRPLRQLQSEIEDKYER